MFYYIVYLTVTVSVVVPTVTVLLTDETSIPIVTESPVPFESIAPVATVVALEAEVATVFADSVHGVIVPLETAGTIVCVFGAATAGVNVCVLGALTAP